MTETFSERGEIAGTECVFAAESSGAAIRAGMAFLRIGLAFLILAFALLPRGVHATGGQFGLEFAIDAPWRLEPIRGPNGQLVYGPVPITIAFHDAVFEVARGRAASLVFDRIRVGRLKEVRVREYVADQPTPRQPLTVVTPSALREIERRPLVSTRTREPDTEICRPTPGRDCAALLEISTSHDWQGAFWYTPRTPVTPGRNIHLEITVVTTVVVPAMGPFIPARTLTREWTNLVVVHAGEEPLPRFGDDWLYGDLHYHGQMTDNEGESGYSYRNVARALGAMGMDFVFATDHASNGEQVDGGIDAEYCVGGHSSCTEARDLNPNRFGAAKTILYASDGVNATIASEGRALARFATSNILPQVYMGEEVDVWPEISSREFNAGLLSYGDGLSYPWPDSNGCIARNNLATCQSRYSQRYAPRDHRSHLLLDEQGIPIEEEAGAAVSNETVRDVVVFIAPDGTAPMPSRQHLVYLPNSATTGRDGWIGGDTGRFGGAGKRLEDVLREIEAGGVAFLAHPMIGNRPGGPGPDVVPYSDAALVRAWRSPAILGLQLWNENDQHYSAPDRRNPTVIHPFTPDDQPRTTQFSFRWPFQQHDFGAFPWTWQHAVANGPDADLYHGAFTWDRFLRRGLDPAQTGSLAWLPPGQPRKWFMAGGSDAHGDFNYRRYGRPCLGRWCDVPVTDTAIGNPRNLVSMARRQTGPLLVADALDTAAARGGPRRHSNQQVIAALRAGNFSVTDGPALRIAIDRNRNGRIDATDLAMGETFDFFPGEHIPLLVEWLSTAEFGPITRIDLYVGNQDATFASEAVRPPGRGAGYARDPSNVLRIDLADNFGRPLPGQPAQIGRRGVARVFLGPAQFGLARADGALSYVRAVARTIDRSPADDLDICPPQGIAGNRCGHRAAYSNPIWNRYRLTCPPRHRFPDLIGTSALGGGTGTFVDVDNDAVPDTCESNIPDPCRPPAPHDRFGGLTNFGRDPPVVSADPDRPRPLSPAKPIPATSCRQLPG
jgi:hypothetical protein